jgi:AraC-like DNA-binding protein
VASTPGALRVNEALAAQLSHAFAALEVETASLEAPLAVEALMASLVEEVFRQDTETRARSERKTDRRGRMVERIRETLVRGARFDEPPPSLETLSSELGLSRFQALRLFRQRYGITPHAYQLHLRVALARRSLRAGRSLAEVAASFGFVDQSHFTKQFKRLVGITPGQYARPRRPSA